MKSASAGACGGHMVRIRCGAVSDRRRAVAERWLYTEAVRWFAPLGGIRFAGFADCDCGCGK